MYPRAFLEELLTLLETRGQIGPRARVRLTSLLGHGLHPEQILVGGGVLSETDYRALLSELTKTTVLSDPPPSSWSCELPPGFTREFVQRSQVLPWKEGEGRWTIGYVRPWDQDLRARVRALATAHDWEERPVVLLRGDWRRLMPGTSRVVQAHLRLARIPFASTRTNRQEVWFMNPEQPRWQVHEDPRFAHEVVPAAYVPALARRLRRHASSQHRIELRPVEEGMILRLQRASPAPVEHHPSTWLRSLGSETPPFPGLSVFVGTDPLFHTEAQRGQELSSSDLHEWREESLLRAERPTATEQELLRHALMAGKSVVIQVSEQDEPWWESVAAAGIPVRVIHKRVLPEGESWVSYEL